MKLKKLLKRIELWECVEVLEENKNPIYFTKNFSTDSFDLLKQHLNREVLNIKVNRVGDFRPLSITINKKIRGGKI